MKTLLILRHAKSGKKDTDMPDHDRPLKERGRRDAPRMGQVLLAQRLTPHLILSSTATRARRTAELVAEACDYAGDPVLTPEFYCATPDAYIERLRELDDRYAHVLVVGHNPGLELLLEQLTGESHRLPTAGLAQVHLPIASWQDLAPSVEGNLVHLWRPKELV